MKGYALALDDLRLKFALESNQKPSFVAALTRKTRFLDL